MIATKAERKSGYPVGPTLPAVAVTMTQAGRGVGVGVAGPGVGVIPFVVMVIKPLFCGGENELRSISINSKSLGNALQAKALVSPAFVLTRFQ